MIFTDKRIVPKLMDPNNRLVQEHIYRYKFAKEYCQGRVLDVGCGVGYGSEIIAKDNPVVTEWIGIDNCQACIAYAKHHYSYSTANYYLKDALDKGLFKLYGTFDVILCFQTLEYLLGGQQLIENLYPLLTSDGTLLVSASLKVEVPEFSSSSFQTHKQQMYELFEVLAPFKSIEMYEQMDLVIEKPKPNKDYCTLIALCKK